MFGKMVRKSSKIRSNFILLFVFLNLVKMA